MRAAFISGVILFMLAVSAISLAKDESIPQLLARAEAARTEDRPPLYTEAAERRLHNADDLYNEGRVEEARAAVTDVVSYSEKASQAATQTGKRLKNTEIAVRKMAEKLRDIKRSLAFEDQPAVQAAIDRLESLRTGMLNRMFGKGAK
jgi:hypothetical protein